MYLTLQNKNASLTTKGGKRQIKRKLRSLTLFQSEKVRGLCNERSLLHFRDFFFKSREIFASGNVMQS